jgi:hypothetical protein
MSKKIWLKVCQSLDLLQQAKKKYKRKNICQDDSSLSCGPMGEIKKSR